jgi:hypothetical protein
MKSRALYNRFLGLSAAALALWTPWLPAQAEARCLDVALVLAVDGSSSVDGAEYQLQKQGIAEALRDPQVIAAMRQAGDVAVSVIFWGDAGQPHQTIGWIRIADGKDGDRLAERIERMPRAVKGSTGLGSGLVAALDMIADADFCANRAIINVSGDGAETIYRRQTRHVPKPEDARARAEEAGVTINALAISNQEGGLKDYFASQVVTGPGAFVMEVKNYESFAEAMRRKLIREITPMAVSGLDLSAAWSGPLRMPGRP